MKNFKQKPPTTAKAKPGMHAGPVTDYMARDLITFRPDTGILDAIATLNKNKISGAPVLDEKGNVQGMIDDKDCLKVLIDSFYHRLPVHNNTVSKYMDTVMKEISANTDIVEVASIFLDTTYKRLLVVDENKKLIGQISRSDVLKIIGGLKQV